MITITLQPIPLDRDMMGNSTRNNHTVNAKLKLERDSKEDGNLLELFLLVDGSHDSLD